MSEALTVRGVMAEGGPTLAPGDPIRRAVAALVETGAQAAAVVEADGRLCGILTEKDCFRPVLHASYYQEWRGTVADHMSPEVVSIDVEEDVVRAAEMFLELPHRVMPVIDKGRLVGMLGRAAVMAALYRSG